MHRTSRTPYALLFLPSIALAVAGCIGPTAMRATHGQYNEAIRVITAEQMLRNLVRIRYGQSLVFLNVTSVSTQFSMDHSATIAGTINEGPTSFNPDTLGLGASANFSERPTITYQPLTGEDFVSRMLAPIGLDIAVMMTAAGWGPERVFQTITYQINGVENPIGPHELTPDLKDDAGKASPKPPPTEQEGFEPDAQSRMSAVAPYAVAVPFDARSPYRRGDSSIAGPSGSPPMPASCCWRRSDWSR